MEKVIFKNSNGESLELSNKPPFFLNSKSGFTNVINTISTVKSYNQDGATKTNESIGPRELGVIATIVAQDRETLLKLKKEVMKIVNPKLGGIIYYYNAIGSYRIDVSIDETTNFSNEAWNVITFEIGFIATNPYWKSEVDTVSEIALWKPNLEFEEEILSEGLELGYREPSLIGKIVNNGDVSCGMTIEFKALGTLSNPILFNLKTREYIKINKEMIAGEIVTVTTHFANKKITVNRNGVKSNGFKYLTDIKSKFLQLSVGENLFRYDADTNLESLEVRIKYSEQFVGV